MSLLNFCTGKIICVIILKPLLIMTFLKNKLKLAATGIMALSFFIAVALSSCDTKSKKDSKTTEEHPSASSEAHDSTSMKEHPAGGEHPSDDAKKKSDEHPSDDSKKKSEEHPAK